MFSRNLICFAAFLVSLLLSTFAHADSHSGEVKFEPVRVTEKISMLVAKGGGNVGVFIGEDGTFLIDDQFAPLTETLLESIKALGGGVPNYLINTHYHGDHTGGNENLDKAGAVIVAHDNVRLRLREGTYLKTFDMRSSPMDKEGLPTITFAEDIKFHLNGDTVQVFHIPNAHTDGDAVVHFTAANVFHAGDIFFNGFYPFIDIDHGGSLRGMIAAVDQLLLKVNADSKIIPGHGPLADKEDLKKYRAMLVTVDQSLRSLKEKGLSLDEALAKKPLAALDKVWAGGIFSSDEFVKMLYLSL